MHDRRTASIVHASAWLAMNNKLIEDNIMRIVEEYVVREQVLHDEIAKSIAEIEV